MAKAVTEDQLKHRKRARRRLIGAVALVLLAVIILPLALDDEPAPLPPELAIKTPADGNFSSRVVPVPETPPPPPPGGPEMNSSLEKPPPPVAAADASPATPAPSPAAPPTSKNEADKPGGTKPASKPPALPDKKPPPPKTPRGDAYVVQLESFANAANARQLQEKLNANGVKSYTEVVETRQGKLTRVRVGPFPDREAAEQALAKLKALGFNGVVRP